MEPKKPRILVCPLDWGLGHATRCIPVIRALAGAGAVPVIASDGRQLTLLRTEFPDAEYVELPGYGVRYSVKVPAALFLLLSVPRLLHAVIREHRKLKKLVRELNIDAVISDNRYGLWHRRIPSALITHQLNIIPPPFLRVFAPFLREATRFFIRRFDECWVPDFAGTPNLSGKLSHGSGIPANTRYIGLLSRFSGMSTGNGTAKEYDILALVSGPEPQRSIFENLLKEQFPLQGKRCLLLSGTPENQEIRTIKPGLDAAGHLPAGQLEALLGNGPLVIARSGYSTLMDLAFTGNKAILVPTPGQTEQEYLAGFLDNQGFFTTCRQSDLNLSNAVEKAMMRPGLNPEPGNGLLTETIKNFIAKR